MPTDTDKQKSVDIGHWSSQMVNAPVTIAQRYTRVYRHVVAADTAANTNVAETTGAFAEYQGKISRLQFVPTGTTNYAINTTNYAYITVSARSGDGASTRANIGFINTAVTALVGNQPTDFSTNAQLLAIPANYSITIQQDKYLSTGTGGLQFVGGYSIIVALEDT